ncbi:TIGR04076 family protein [Desulfosporosinus sp. PR]|uniref:TIGR04076 family protein n=1 Tax=Candidatus Desulfosporosinus nitrosoreducens TaxID=3401928 RepID=UPI0027EC240C|nr:TIGR04076 family protein [Desulfosporosinus sp. PR]MDQ7094625.1 TIGR04076 family protein [Desulfosporosinus sp. PR]
MGATKYYDVKISVLKKLDVGAIYEEYASEGVPAVCAKYQEGQVFIAKNCHKPDGFCSWAWAGLQDKVVFLALGHDYPWIKQKGTEIFSCADGLHPVLYKLERIETASPLT